MNARSSRDRSSRRAASSAWIVGGTAAVARSPVGSQRSSSRWIRPLSTNIETSCATNSGLPSDGRDRRARRPPPRPGRRGGPRRAGRVADGSSAGIGIVGDVGSCRPLRPLVGEVEPAGRDDEHGRLRPDVSRRCSSRSRNVSSALWASSMQTTSGRRAPTGPRGTCRAAQKISVTGKRSDESPTTEAIRSRISVADCGAIERRADLRDRGSRACRRRRCRRRPATISTSGQKVMPSPYGRQRPRSTVVAAATSTGTTSTRKRLADAGLAEDRGERARRRGSTTSRSAARSCSSWSSRPTS